MSAKKALEEIARRITDETSYDDIIEELEFRKELEESLAQAERGEVVSHEELKRQMTTWLS